MAKAKVQNVAFSDDCSKMVVTLKMNLRGDSGKLFEVFFEHDEFGRMISTNDGDGEREVFSIWPK